MGRSRTVRVVGVAIDPQKSVLCDWAGCDSGKSVFPVLINAALMMFVSLVRAGDQYIDVEQIEHA